jgi:pectin methylesterase-like acyl-CoA thioesterase
MPILTVGPAGVYSTIQAAIDAASADDIIQVEAGVYSGNIEIPAGKDGLTILGVHTGVPYSDIYRDLGGGNGESTVEGRGIG